MKVLEKSSVTSSSFRVVLWNHFVVGVKYSSGIKKRFRLVMQCRKQLGSVCDMYILIIHTKKGEEEKVRRQSNLLDYFRLKKLNAF